MASFPEPPGCARFRELFPGKDQSRVSPFVSEWHSVGERVSARCPSHVHSQGLIDPRSRCVERLVPKGLNHPQKLWLSPCARHLGYKTDDSRHISCVQERTLQYYCAD